MTFQSTVNLTTSLGLAGSLYTSAPVRGQSLIINSASAAYNIVGATAFTVSSEGIAAAGGTGFFIGILSNPHAYATSGTTSGTLTPTLTLPNYTQGEFVRAGELVVTLPAAAAIGDKVVFDTTTGALSTVAPTIAATGSIATTVLTVSAITAGSIGVGSIITGANVTAGTTVVSLGTGTGGTGTYNVSISQTAASAAIAGNSTAASGKAFVPNSNVSYFTVTAAGLGVISLANA